MSQIVMHLFYTARIQKCNFKLRPYTEQFTLPDVFFYAYVTGVRINIDSLIVRSPKLYEKEWSKHLSQFPINGGA